MPPKKVDICELCHQKGTTKDPINKHHIKGKQYPDVMYVHSKTCHVLAQWLTNLYLLNGMEDRLDENFIAYMFNRIATLRDPDQFILPVYKGKE